MCANGRRQYDRQTRLPRPLVEETVRVTSLAQAEWAAARRDADFARFRRGWNGYGAEAARGRGRRLPDGTLRRPARRVRAGDDRPRPGACVLRSERGIIRIGGTAGRTRRAGRTPPCCAATTRWSVSEPSAPRRRSLGFDFRRGRLDDTTHPFFAAIGPGDCRITTRYNPHDFGDAFFSTLHEVGHGLYEQALDPSAYGLPVGERRRWAPTNRRPACGKTPSAVASPFGSISSRWPVGRSRKRWATSA